MGEGRFWQLTLKASPKKHNIGLVVSRVLGIPEAMTLTAATMQILNQPKNDHSVKNKKVKSATDD